MRSLQRACEVLAKRHGRRAAGAILAVAFASRFWGLGCPKIFHEVTTRLYTVMPLEGLWWTDDMDAFANNERDQWGWTMMNHQPEFITPEMVQEAMVAMKRKKGLQLEGMRFKSFTEGRCAQIMHIGPFSEEGPNIQKVHSIIEEHDISGTASTMRST